MGRKYTFSVVYIMRNEEKHIRTTLGVQPIKDFIAAGGEVVVFDTGSTDSTPKIGEELGCKVVLAGNKFAIVLTEAQASKINKRFCWKNEPAIVKAGERIFDFGSARNAAGDSCSNDMVLQVDTNDLVEALDFDKIQEMLDTKKPLRFDYNHYLGHGGHKQIISRFYHRKHDRWSGKTHESLGWNGTYDTKISLKDDELRIRYMRDNTKVRNYFGGMALDLIDKPDEPRWYHYLGREMYYTERWHSAIALLEKQGEMSFAFAPERSHSLCIAGECWEKLGNMDKALANYHKALSVDSGRREPWVRAGHVYLKKDMFQSAAGFAYAAAAIPHTSVLYEPAQFYTHEPHYILYRALFWLNRKTEAKLHYDICMAYDPDNFMYQHDGKFFTELERGPCPYCASSPLKTDSDQCNTKQ